MPSTTFDGPRLVRSEDLRASNRLSQICFEAILETGEEEPELPPQFHEGDTYMMTAGGRPVSQISIFHTPLKIYDGVIRVGSIGGVCTHPDFRGHGLASQLMEHCTRKLVEGGAGLMLISGGRGLYTRLGNVPGGKYAGFRLTSAAFHAPEQNIRLRPVTGADASLCSRFYHAEPVHFTRPMDGFHKYFHPHDIGYRAEEWIVERDGQPAAYLLCIVPWEYLHQPDAGVRAVDEYAGSRVALAGAMAAALAQPGIKEIRAPIPWQDVDFIHLLKEYGGSPQWTHLQDHTMRIINFPALMAGLRPYIQARLEPALRRGLRFEQSGPLLGNAEDSSDQGCCTIIRGRDRLDLDTASMTRLVMGDPHEKLGGISAPGALAEIIPALFPLPSFLPGLDYH